MQRRAADARRLQDQAHALAPADPRTLRAVGRPPAEASIDDRAHVVLEPGEIPVGVEPRPCLEQEDLRALLGQLLRDDGASAARPDDDGVRARVHR